MIKPSLQLQSNGRQIGMGDWLGLVFEINTARAETRMFRVARVQLALRAAKRCQHYKYSGSSFWQIDDGSEPDDGVDVSAIYTSAMKAGGGV
jgi:hypothetical protein